MLLVLVLAGCSGPAGDSDAGHRDRDAGYRDDGAEPPVSDAAATDASRADGSIPGDGGRTGDAGRSAPYATLDLTCDAGPFPTDDLAPEGCGPENEPRCPAQAPAGAVPVAKVATCAYGRGEAECEPIVGGNCGTTEGVFYDFNLINPNRDAPIGCWARAHLLLEPAADGLGFHVEWGAYAMNNADCSDAGMAEGELDIENTCCEQVIDLHFPHGEFTFRMAVRIDWAPAP